MAFLLLAFACSNEAVMSRLLPRRRRNALRRCVQTFKRIWTKAGMRFKIKMLISLYQCIAAIPSVYNVDPPDDVQALTGWINLLEWPADLSNFLIPAACFGSYRQRCLRWDSNSCLARTTRASRLTVGLLLWCQTADYLTRATAAGARMGAERHWYECDHQTNQRNKTHLRE